MHVRAGFPPPPPQKHRFHPGTGDRERIESLAAWVSAWPDKEGMEGVAVAISPDWGRFISQPSAF